MSNVPQTPEDSVTRELFVKPGISKSEQLVPVALPPGMGTAFPIAASPDRYCGTLTLNPGDGFNFHYHSHHHEVVYVVEGEAEGLGLSRASRPWTWRCNVHSCGNRARQLQRIAPASETA